MAPRTWFDWFLLILRLGIGAMFLVSGGQKVFAMGPAEFGKAISHYQIFLEPWNLILAYALPWVEIVAGGCLLGGVLTRGALLASLGMTGMFLFGIGQAWARHLDISCGCFGKSDIAVNYPLHFTGLLALAAALTLLWGRRDPAVVN